jgi:NADPH-dependent glutamate synthase beta subunit-like oxidoreductase
MPPKISKSLDRQIIYSKYTPSQLRNSPCESECPAGNPVQKITRLIKDGDFDNALENILARNPFPGTCGRVCHHPCETKCNRNNYDQGISIKALERAAFDHAEMDRLHLPKPLKPTGKRVAIIGAGPAGLTCAYFLRLLGHDITVFEALPSPGGMPLSGIPTYRLPVSITTQEVERILQLGIQMKTNTTVGKDISFTEIQSNYDAVLIAAGAWKSRKLANNSSANMVEGLSFLRLAKSGKISSTGTSVAIIGGGGVAFDCAFTAKRLGASEVNIICLEASDCMLATPEDVAQAAEEGIQVHNSASVSMISTSTDNSYKIEYRSVRSIEYDKSSGLQIITDDTSNYSLCANQVISAIGQIPDLDFLPSGNTFERTPSRCLQINPYTHSTSVKGVFAAGDAASGPASIASAIGCGREAAISIHRYLSDENNQNINEISITGEKEISIIYDHSIDLLEEPQHIVAYNELLHVDYFANEERVPNTKLPQTEYSGSFSEINQGYSKEQAMQEASRCFHCGQCFSCGKCVEDCPGYVLAMGDKGPIITHPDECWHCGNCRISCPCGAIQYEFPLTMLV